MLQLLPLLGLIVTNLLLAQASEPTEVRQMPPLFLTTGEQRLIRIPNLARYSLGNQKIRVLRPPLLKRIGTHKTQDSLLLKAVEEGICDLWVWKSDGVSEQRRIQIQRTPLNHPRSQLDLGVEKLSEVEVLHAGPSIILRGEVLTLPESARIAALLGGFPEAIQDETTPSQTLLQSASEQIENWLKTSGYSTKLKLEKIGSHLWIKGALTDPNQAHSAKKQLLALFPLLLFDLESLPDHSQTLSFKIFLLEVKKSQFNNLGLFWGATTPVALQVAPESIQDPLKIDLAIQHLEGQGYAKVLSNPELVVRAPGEAELFAGGELPIVTRSRFNSNVKWKKYGLTLHLKITHRAGDRVRLDILTEVSHLAAAGTADGIPGIQSNRMTTQVDAQFGAPLFLSGLLQNTTREDAKGLPGLRNIPILGSLFGSEDYLNERSELVAILLPRISPSPVSPEDLRQKIPHPPVHDPKDQKSWTEEAELKSSKDFPWNVLK
jgi:hypothetical protein